MNVDLDEKILLFFHQEVFRPRDFNQLKSFFLPLKNEIEKQKCKVITIVGTNGKGETSHYLARLLRQQHKNFVLFTSPHLVTVRERFQTNSGMIESLELDQLLLNFQNSHPENDLSYFEGMFYLFLKWAINKKPDYIILEVGLGGRLDATNVIDADVVGVTSISRDHQEFLGHRYDQILKEKLGVTRSTQQVFSALTLSYLTQQIKKKSEEDHFSLTQLKDKYCDFSKLNFRFKNFLVAYSIFNFLIPEVDEIHDLHELEELQLHLLARFPIEGRGEIIKYGNKKIHFYGSHNVEGIRALRDQLNQEEKKFALSIFGFSKRYEKDIDTMIKVIEKSPCFGKVLFVNFSHPKAFFFNTDHLSKMKFKVMVFNHSTELSDYLNSISVLDVLVAGSYYFYQDIKNLSNK